MLDCRATQRGSVSITTLPNRKDKPPAHTSSLLLWLFILSTSFVLRGAIYMLCLLDPSWELWPSETQHLLLEVWPVSFAPRCLQRFYIYFRFTVEKSGLGADFCGMRPPTCQSLAVTPLFWGLASSRVSAHLTHTRCPSSRVHIQPVSHRATSKLASILTMAFGHLLNCS